MKTIHAEVVILGGGTAGMGAYRAARAHTENVYLIENHAFGTTCARVGCMPSKLLIAAAEAAHQAQHTAPFGVHIEGAVRIDGTEVMSRVKSERDRFVGFVVSDVEEWPADKRIMGTAQFIDAHTIQVDEHTRIPAKRIVIATGSRPHILPEWQALGDKLIVNDDVFDWNTLPKRVAVFGQGIIGLELGQALARLGVQVDIFGRSGNLGGITDPVVLAEAKTIFHEELNLHLNTKTHVDLDEQGQVVVQFEENDQSHQITADYLLAATGRTPNTDNIGLEHLNIEMERGVPKADPLTMQTSIPHIFIAGDASNQLPLLHEASDQARIAGHNAGGFPNIEPGLRRSPIAVVFSDPQIAVVGTRFAQLAAQFDLPNEVLIGEVSFRNQGRSRVMLKNKGHLRVYAQQGTGLFLGAEMVGPAAEHIAHLLAWAHQQKMTIQHMLDMPFYHPVIEEGLRTALRDAHKQLKLITSADEAREHCPGE